MEKAQKIYTKWLIFFSFLCVINSIVIIGFSPGLNNNFLDDFTFAFLLPFIHCGLVWVVFAIYTAYYYSTNYLKEGDPSFYIKQNYPQIWTKLHPLGDLSNNSFAYFDFYGLVYDDGSDPCLNKIRILWKKHALLEVATFFLVPSIWFFNLFLVYLRTKFTCSSESSDIFSCSRHLVLQFFFGLS